jgi:hypothetical protein
MGPSTPTHFDLFVALTVIACFGLTCVIILGWMVWDGKKTAERNFAEARRMTRAVAGLVVQESEKIRELMRD